MPDCGADLSPLATQSSTTVRFLDRYDIKLNVGEFFFLDDSWHDFSEILEMPHLQFADGMSLMFITDEEENMLKACDLVPNVDTKYIAPIHPHGK